MKTLVVVPHHRNHHQYFDRNPGHGTAKLGSFEVVATGHFQGINCRTSQPGAGLLPTPTKSYSSTIPVIRRAFSSSFSPKTPSPTINGSQKSSKRNMKSCAIPIPFNIKFENNDRSASDGFHFSERWAGPAYSNSPPPSSLPMPKFSFQPRRTVSLDLATSPPENDLSFIMKSAPASPSRKHNPLPDDLLALVVGLNPFELSLVSFTCCSLMKAVQTTSSLVLKFIFIGDCCSYQLLPVLVWMLIEEGASGGCVSSLLPFVIVVLLVILFLRLFVYMKREALYCVLIICVWNWCTCLALSSYIHCLYTCHELVYFFFLSVPRACLV